MSASAKALAASRPVTHIGPLRAICVAKLQKISGITSKNGRNGTKWLNINTVRVSDDAKPKMLKKQRKAELSRRTVCKSLPAER